MRQKVVRPELVPPTVGYPGSNPLLQPVCHVRFDEHVVAGFLQSMHHDEGQWNHCLARAKLKSQPNRIQFWVSICIRDGYVEELLPYKPGASTFSQHTGLHKICSLDRSSRQDLWH